MKVMLSLALLLYLIPCFAESRTLLFDVYLDDEQIGSHQVYIADYGEEKLVEVKADMQVDLVFITLYKYQHEASERWQKGCIAQLETKTNDDGDKLQVSGEKIQEGLKVVSTRDSKVISDCVRTYAYWDPELLNSEYLLNTQNGKYQPAQLVNEGKQPMLFQGKRYGQQRYRLTVGDEISIKLWYGTDNSWQALETNVAGDRTLRYVRRETNT